MDISRERRAATDALMKSAADVHADARLSADREGRGQALAATLEAADAQDLDDVAKPRSLLTLAESQAGRADPRALASKHP